MIPEHLQDLYDIPLRFKELRLAGARRIALEDFSFILPFRRSNAWEDRLRRPWWAFQLSYETTELTELWHLRIEGPYSHNPTMHFSFQDFEEVWDVIIAVVRGDSWTIVGLREFFDQR
jgi:hypothetical protein